MRIAFMQACKMIRHAAYIIEQGNSAKDRINLLICISLDYLFKNILNARMIVRIINKLIEKTILCVNGVRYNLMDYDSMLIVLPHRESWMWDYLKPKSGDVFIDVGAHIGKYALQVANIVGEEGLVIAVEPVPKNYHAIMKSIQANKLKNVKVLNIAAYEKECNLHLFIGDVGAVYSVKWDSDLGYIEVPARALDSCIGKLSVRQVDWIKIDVEGAEYEVLNGLQSTLRVHHPKLIVEVFKENMLEVKKLLSELGYVIDPINVSEGPNNIYLYCHSPVNRSLAQVSTTPKLSAHI